MIEIDVLQKIIETIRDEGRVTHVILRRNKLIFIRKIQGSAGEKPITVKIASVGD